MSRYIVLLLFFIAYYFIIFKKDKSSVTTFLIGLMVGIFKVGNLKIENASEFIDFNTISLLVGMMIIISVLKSTGFFQFIAVKTVKISGSNIFKLLLLMNSIIFVFSALLDNVTTILLFIPLLLLISDTADIPPNILIFTAILSANLGGSATLIGDPPNIIIGSAAKISFLTFLKNMIIPSIIAFITVSFYFFKIMKFPGDVNQKLKNFIQVDATTLISNYPLMIKTLIIFLGVVIGFVVHEYIDYEMSLISLTGAALILLLSGKNFENTSKDIEWDTLFFFIGLFSLTYALEVSGLTELITHQFLLLEIHPKFLTIIMFWAVFLFSGIVGAVPSTMIFIPIIEGLINSGMSFNLWWSLALGAGFGSNLTPIGAASNIVSVSLLEKHTEKRLSFGKYIKISIVPTLACGIIATVYLFIKEALTV
ncbi:anion permease [Thermosipho ferrireducens]|uniref:Anion permease n=1 Tax=Thermosipho ferrireducens TaxID=2571116 RepID=A0ABX7S4K3_9BACT|nr:SLC13 family permease [Thermosipho ferrireducens]QTA37393.1 anion permease [Thermosipho ferrireducens]